MRNLIIVAHPDDEALWFTSVLSRTTCDVVCVTAGRDDLDRALRTRAFSETMVLFNVDEYKLLWHQDVPRRLDLAKLQEDLYPFTRREYDAVYTHGPYGDTNEHMHHQDVSYVVSRIFRNVRYTAWNLYPDVVNVLSPEEYHLKKYVIGTIYEEEYDHLKESYEISAVEKFVELTADSIDIHYWGIVNFGDHHEQLAAKYEDFWGFKNSPYEIERHAMIASLVKVAGPMSILEFGAGEGVLSDRLGKIAPVSCVERVPAYVRTLRMKGYPVVADPDTASFDVSVIAAFLEYIDDPTAFLRSIKSRHIVVDVINRSSAEKTLEALSPEYRIVRECVVRGRWEQMFHAEKKEKLEVYRLGAHGHLFEKN